MSSTQLRSSQSFATSRTASVLAISAATALLVSTVVSATPWPSALLIRSAFEAGARATVKEMLPYVPSSGISEELDVEIPLPSGSSTLDVFTPSNATGPLPTVVWVHGGAWISGSKTNVAPYLRILASRGYTTVGVSYPIAPETTYPTAVHDLNDTLAYITENADDLGVDPTRIILAGDSAGAQLASSLATVTTNPAYAHLLGVTPSLSSEQLIGTILHCGVYDLDAMADLNGLTAWGFKVALWAYTGTKDWSDTYAGTTMSTMDFVTDGFPPTFISGGNGDSLTWIQSVPMSTALKSQGVAVTELFWPASHEPALPHEYQFHLDFEEARSALDDTVTFLDRLTR
ncbi:alpha/beta hydrolase [Mycetocola zhadangensis]|uniref:Alpha/beta hydrolase n=1 Tax=Mycetocola zhadangensis TaxID=1164595 RepID=A0A3L7IWL5_9MICO|nr:alpha/beta hydrolase [Mycetocola zhadangensis]RLQ81482.1 alpha/beta hydrolase [Mycetocola zhadangensis]GGF01325.1 lipase [Mycetocola zhadangensis]